MKEILLIDGGNWNGVTTVQVNVINFFLDKGSAVKVVLFDNGMKPSPLKYDRWPKHENVEYIAIDQTGIIDKIFNRTLFLRSIRKFFKAWHILKKYNRYYAFEYEAGIICRFARFFFSGKSFFVHSIELYEETAGSWLIRNALNHASAIIIQDWVRRDKIISLYNLKETSRIVLSVNSSRDNDRIETDVLEFPSFLKDKVKVLFIGSLIDQHCYGAVLEATRNIPDSMCLIIHGWGGDAYESLLKDVADRRPKNVWLSKFTLDDASKFRLYSSIDIGLVTFNKAYFNGEYAGLSAGKLYDFMRVGKPVVVSNILGLNEFVIENQIGAVVEDEQKIYKAVGEVLMKYDLYAKNAYRLFPQYEFDTNFQGIFNSYVRS